MSHQSVLSFLFYDTHITITKGKAFLTWGDYLWAEPKHGLSAMCKHSVDCPVMEVIQHWDYWFGRGTLNRGFTVTSPY
jgi:hypothetical protein